MFRHIFRFLFVFALVAGGMAYAAVPGWHRALTPGVFGLTRISPNAYIDDPAQGARVLALIARAEETSGAFFGPTTANPMYVICTAAPCHEAFGSPPRGLTLGSHIILISPSGVNELILTHERIHADLHSFMGITDIMNQRFPAWFDEGLSSFLTGDHRLTLPRRARDADWIRTAKSFRDWGAINQRRDWRETYGAAYRLVAEIEAAVGRDGLRALIRDVADGADFDASLRRALGQ